MVNKKRLIIIFSIITSIFIIYISYFREREYIENIHSLNTYEEYIEANNNNTLKEQTEENNIVVHITGAITNEGLYKLKENSRIADIIEIAGGLTNEADITNINLASIVEDGTKIYIPKKSDNNNKITEDTNLDISKENSDFENSNNSNKNNKININRASQIELETLPGIGESTAKKIIEYRKKNGKFNKIEDIKKVSGIGNSKYNKIKNLIKV